VRPRATTLRSEIKPDGRRACSAKTCPRSPPSLDSCWTTRRLSMWPRLLQSREEVREPPRVVESRVGSLDRVTPRAIHARSKAAGRDRSLLESSRAQSLEAMGAGRAAKRMARSLRARRSGTGRIAGGDSAFDPDGPWSRTSRARTAHVQPTSRCAVPRPLREASGNTRRNRACTSARARDLPPTTETVTRRDGPPDRLSPVCRPTTSRRAKGAISQCLFCRRPGL